MWVWPLDLIYYALSIWYFFVVCLGDAFETLKTIHLWNKGIFSEMFHSKNHLGLNHMCDRVIHHLQSMILLLSLITSQPLHISWRLCFQLQNRSEYLLLTYPLPKKSELIEVQLPFFQPGISHDTLLYSTSSETMGGI